MTRKNLRRLYIFVISIWLVVLIKLLLLLSNIDESLTQNKPQQDKTYNIEYFKRYYILSTVVDSNNKNGYDGKGVEIDDTEKQLKEERFNLHKFNELASSKIPLLRALPEKRRSSCFKRQYPLDLPTTSIIIIYHNEAFSTLARTVHTALSRSPDYLVKEVILVDDASDYERFPHLQKELDDHFENLPKVKIIRSQERIGLTQARLKGAEIAQGDVLVFLDSHCECFDGWLEPLLLDIKQNPTHAITPIIDVISLEDFSVSSGKITAMNVGTFTWKADFTWYIPKNQDNDYSPVKSPTMAGGLFAINREYFFDSGSYDDKMTYWGGENIEMSFRLWMCGGAIYSDPCSVIGHVFRTNSPHDMALNSVFYNKLRAVETWMDEYKHLVYSRIGVSSYDSRAGSLEERIELRKRLNCKSFKWYLENIATDLRVPGKVSAIQNPKSEYCLDAMNNHKSANKPVRVIKCHNFGGNQGFEVVRDGQIIFDEYCLDLSTNTDGSEPVMYGCHGLGGNQKWEFKDNKLIQHSSHKLCLKIDPTKQNLIAVSCDVNDEYQHFTYTFSDSS